MGMKAFEGLVLPCGWTVDSVRIGAGSVPPVGCARHAFTASHGECYSISSPPPPRASYCFQVMGKVESIHLNILDVYLF